MKSSEITEKARAILLNNRYMTLATSGGEVLPWASPVAYAVDGSWRFYWYSARNAVHSENILHNQNVTAAVFNSTASFDEVDGIQMAGLAEVLPVSQTALIHELYWAHCFPDPDVRKKFQRPISDFEGSSILRYFSFQPLDMWKYDTETTDFDQRLMVDLKAL
jgi:uncharacterized protein YhbP (UPF0306 family)